MACHTKLVIRSIQLATVTAALSLTLAGCSGNTPQTSGPSPTASSTALPADSTDATHAASEPIKAASAKPANGSTADARIKIAKKSVTGKAAPLAVDGVSPKQANGYQRPAANANGYVGPSEEYYSYKGYVQPGFEYQVGSECFDPALGRCKSSGEVQSEWLQLQASQNG